MISVEDECVDCGLPCLGSSCRYRNVKHYICDECGDEPEHLYKWQGRELCLECIEQELERVDE